MKSRLRLLVVVVVMVAMFATGVAEAVPVFTTTGLATSATLNEVNPEIDGEWVTYQYFMPIMPGAGWNVVLRNLRSGETTTLGLTSDGDLTNPDVSQGRVVYEDDTNGHSNVYMHTWGAAYISQIASTTAEEIMPRIDGDLIAYYNATDDTIRYLFGYMTVPDAENVTHLDVDNGRIFWSDALVTQNVYVFEPGIDTVSDLVYTAPSGADIESISAHGDWFAITLDQGGTRTAMLRHIADDVFSATTVGNEPSAFHNSFAAAVLAAPSDISFKAIDLMGAYTVADSDADETDPALFGHRVVYEHEVTSLNHDIYFASAASDVVRTQGADRYLTAIEASKAYFRSADVAVICTGRNFPDALAAVPLARAVRGPLLLSDTNAISNATVAELSRLGVAKCYVIGGPDVVSTAVVGRLQTAGFDVERLAGDDRYETAVAIATELDAIVDPDLDMQGAFFARGDNFPDALALGPVAAAKGWPILLVKKDLPMPQCVSDFVESSMDEGGAVAGGEDVISEAVRNSIVAQMGMAPPVYRWAGTDRYGTSVAVVEGAIVKRWIDADTIGIATGANFPDALGGGAAIGNYGSGLLLVGGTSLPTSVGTWLSTNKYNVGRVDIFGGSDVVSDGVKSAIATKLQ